MPDIGAYIILLIMCILGFHSWFGDRLAYKRFREKVQKIVDRELKAIEEKKDGK